MKNLFEISGDEIKRILSLHEESTKQQYLNVLNEGNQDTYKTTKEHKNGSITIPTGTIFSRSKKDGILYANVNNKGMHLTIYYNCKKWFYIVKGYEEKQYDKGLAKELSNFCNSKGGEVKQDNKQNQGTTSYTTELRHTLNNGKTPIPAKTKFIKAEGGASFNLSKVETVTYYASPTQPFTKPEKKDNWCFFSCKDSKFYINKKGYDEDDKSKSLTNKLKGIFCKSDSGKKEDKVQQQYSQQGQTIQQQPSQQPNQEVTNYNTQIQQSLGVQQPSGAITDADLDNILTKLG